MPTPTPDPEMKSVVLGRLVLRDGADHQYIYLREEEGQRAFPIVIGNHEAAEIHRVLHATETKRPFTHQLAFSLIEALGAKLRSVDVVDLRQNTFYAQLVLQNDGGDVITVVDARPSDAIALALRSGCPIRVAEHVFGRAADSGAP